MPPPFFTQVKCDSKHFFIQFCCCCCCCCCCCWKSWLSNSNFQFNNKSATTNISVLYFRGSVTNGFIILQCYHLSPISAILINAGEDC